MSNTNEEGLMGEHRVGLGAGELEEVVGGVPARIVDNPASPPEVLTPEAAEAVKDFNRVLYETELGELDMKTLQGALTCAEELGATLNLNDGYTASRLVDEAKFLLCWRPPTDSAEPSMWITHPDVAARKGDMPSLPREAVRRIEHAVRMAISRSTPKSEELGRVLKVIDFVRDNGCEIDWSDSETVKVFENALSYHKFQGDACDFIRMTESVKMPVSDVVKAHAIEDELTKVFSGFGFKLDDLSFADGIIAFANDRDLRLKLNGNEYLGHHLFGRLEEILKQGSLDDTQDVLDFCKRHGISISNDVKVRLGRQLNELGHTGQERLDLQRIEELLAFAKRNNIDPGLPEEMLARWRVEIPDLIRRRDERRKRDEY